MTSKALSVVKPAGSLIASGVKSLEIRQWKPDQLPLRDLVIVENQHYLSSKDNPVDPDGHAVAIVDILSAHSWSEDGIAEACANYWEEGWRAWQISNVRPIDPPIPAPAKLKIYEVSLSNDYDGS